MKSITTFIVCALAALNVAAQGSASVTFFAQEGEKFWVIMDGIKQNEKADANVRVTGLTKDNYQVKIIFADSKLGSFNKQVYTRDVENKYADVTYKILKNKKGVYVANINSFSEATPNNSANSSVVPFHTTEAPAPAETRPVGNNNAGTGANINQNVNMTGTGATTSQTVTTPDGDNVRMDMNMGATGGGVTVKDGDETINMNLGLNVSGMDMGTQGNVNTNSSTTVTKTTTTTTTTYSSSGGNVGTGNTRPVQTNPVITQPVTNTPPPPANNGGCTFPASSTDMSNLKGSIQKQSFADNKLNVAKTFIKNKCMSVAQIKEVMGLFSFEDNKLEFAKAAYDRCTDKENYFQVGDALTFSSSQDELMDFINSK